MNTQRTKTFQAVLTRQNHRALGFTTPRITCLNIIPPSMGQAETW